jgi:hypothetical protein
LQAIVRAGLQSIQQNPERVTPKDLLAALAMMETLGLGKGDASGYDTAWQNLSQARTKEVSERVVFERHTREVAPEENPDSTDEEEEAEPTGLPVQALPLESPIYRPSYFASSDADEPLPVQSDWTPPNWGESEEHDGRST